MKITEYIKSNITFLDGGMGTMLQKSLGDTSFLPERLNISRPDLITSIHKAYFDAGSNIVSTNTFGANPLKFSHSELEEIYSKSMNFDKNDLLYEEKRNEICDILLI